MNRKALGAVIAAGLILAFVLMSGAKFAMCGMFGCTGGGFGRVTDPATTRVFLVAAGIGAAAPLAWYAAWARNRWLALTAVIVAVLTPVMAGLLIGADIHGCPRHISAQTCAEDESHL